MKFKTCGATRKRRHRSQESAIQAVAEIMARGGAEVQGLNVYRCDACRDWHIGHRPARMRES